jgi:hypothetical protein
VAIAAEDRQRDHHVRQRRTKAAGRLQFHQAVLW